MIKIIKDFVEGNLDAPAFFDVLYSSDEMEAALMSETDLPEWANAATLYYYLISGNNNHTFIWEAKELLGQFLTKNGVTFTPGGTRRDKSGYCIKSSAVLA